MSCLFNQQPKQVQNSCWPALCWSILCLSIQICNARCRSVCIPHLVIAKSCSESLITIMLISSRKTQPHWIEWLIIWHRFIAPLLLEFKRARHHDQSLCPPEAVEALGFGACLQTYCSVCHNSESVSFLSEGLQLFSLQNTHTQYVCCLLSKLASSASDTQQSQSSTDSLLHFGLSLCVVDFGFCL